MKAKQMFFLCLAGLWEAAKIVVMSVIIGFFIGVGVVTGMNRADKMNPESVDVFKKSTPLPTELPDKLPS